jgi:hypothetical protein
VSFDTAPGSVVSGGAGFALLLLAAFILGVQPRRRANLALAVFTAGLGAQTVLWYFWLPDDAPGAALRTMAAAFIFVSAAGLVWLSLVFPQPLAAAQRRLLVLPTALGSISWAISNLGFFSDGGVPLQRLLRTPPIGYAANNTFSLAYNCFVASVTFALTLFALRAGVDRDADARKRYALASAAIAVYPATIGGSLLLTPVGGIPLVGLGLAVGLFACGVLWLRNSRHSATSALARNTALFALGALAAGMALGELLGGFTGAVAAGTLGFSRVLALVLLAFAILRHQLLGIDVKVKWTIRRGTLAGMFLAVFFIVGQLVQNFLSKELDLIAGAVAAGLMLFALSPLQKVAQRVADAAMPGVKAVGEMTPDERLRIYREAVQGAWADGVMTHDERDMLDRLCASLGLHDSEAKRVEREAGQRVRAEGSA